MRLIVGAVIDSSSSMGSHRNSVIGGYNEYLDDLAKEAAEIRMSRTHFDSSVRVEHDALPLAVVPPLTMGTYETGGSTALYDGIGLTITRLEQATEPADKVLVLVMTDGEENISRIWKLAPLKAKIAEKQRQGWVFVFMGANVIDVKKTAGELGILPGDTYPFELTAQGIRGVFQRMTQRTQLLLTDGSKRGPIQL